MAILKDFSFFFGEQLFSDSVLFIDVLYRFSTPSILICLMHYCKNKVKDCIGSFMLVLLE